MIIIYFVLQKLLLSCSQLGSFAWSWPQQNYFAKCPTSGNGELWMAHIDSIHFATNTYFSSYIVCKLGKKPWIVQQTNKLYCSVCIGFRSILYLFSFIVFQIKDHKISLPYKQAKLPYKEMVSKFNSDFLKKCTCKFLLIYKSLGIKNLSIVL